MILLVREAMVDICPPGYPVEKVCQRGKHHGHCLPHMVQYSGHAVVTGITVDDGNGSAFSVAWYSIDKVDHNPLLGLGRLLWNPHLGGTTEVIRFYRFYSRNFIPRLLARRFSMINHRIYLLNPPDNGSGG